MVGTPVCNPYLVYDHRTNIFDTLLAPPRSKPPPPRNAHILPPRPHPGYPTPDLTTTSLNSHVTCTGPQLLIEERPEPYKSTQGVVDDVEEKRTAEGEAFCDIQGWGSDGNRVEYQGTREGEGCVSVGVAVFEIELMDVWYLE